MVRVRSLLGNSQVFHGESGRRAVICCRPGYECLALPVLFACLTGMSSGGRALVPQGNPINNIMADSYVRARLVARRLREFALRMFRGITNKIIGADDYAQ